MTLVRGRWATADIVCGVLDDCERGRSPGEGASGQGERGSGSGSWGVSPLHVGAAFLWARIPGPQQDPKEGPNSLVPPEPTSVPTAHPWAPDSSAISTQTSQNNPARGGAEAGVFLAGGRDSEPGRVGAGSLGPCLAWSLNPLSLHVLLGPGNPSAPAPACGRSGARIPGTRALSTDKTGEGGLPAASQQPEEEPATSAMSPGSPALSLARGQQLFGSHPGVGWTQEPGALAPRIR